jgi:hypothetical protein
MITFHGDFRCYGIELVTNRLALSLVRRSTMRGTESPRVATSLLTSVVSEVNMWTALQGFNKWIRSQAGSVSIVPTQIRS